ncbi:MAG: FHA domain-containing protein [Pseudomonadota bacterium]
MVSEFSQWVHALYQSHPELVLGLAFVALIPILALAGLLFMPRTAGSRTSERQTASVDVAGVEAGWLIRDEIYPDAARLRVGRRGVLVGAGDDVDFHVHGPGIAEYHARFAQDDGGFAIVRLAGDGDVAIYVEGKPQVQARLSGGETIKIGATVLTFEVTCPALDQLTVQAQRKNLGPNYGGRRKGDRQWLGEAVAGSADTGDRSWEGR